MKDEKQTMIRVGIVGLGMMGRTHYEAYLRLPDAQVVAVADHNPARAAGDLTGTAGNVLPGGLNRLPMDRIRGTTDPTELFAMPDVDVVDICVPTPAHAELAVAALRAGKHVICEKPLALSAADAKSVADAARRASGSFMPAMCMRFWPQWEWLKRAVEERRYGAVRSATFRRVASMPGGWYRDGEQSGGAILDLHIHDADFIYHLFGAPRAVFSRGYTKTSGRIDHVVTQYLYDQGPLVSAEGGFCFAGGFAFRMQYTVNFESATADFDLARPEQLLVYHDGAAKAIECPAGYGYERELRYFFDCVANGRRPTRVTAADAVRAIEMVEAERASVERGRPVSLEEVE
jgi:predicted dehydrogenase